MKLVLGKVWRSIVIMSMLIGLALLVAHGCDLLWGNAPMNLYGKLVLKQA